MSDERRLSSSADPEGPNQDSKNKSGAKPRASRAGTRSVSTLNAEQLARKRANDREAQRAIRQRTREHIERLENRIKELSENSPESDSALEAMQRRNAELEEELRQLRKTLFGMAEGSNSPASSHHHPGFVPSSRPKIGSVPYSPQPGWAPQNSHIGFSGLPPTSNPMPEADPSWQPQMPSQHQRRSLPQQPVPGFHQQQPISWSRNESSDSDYDSGFDQGRADHPVNAYPEHMQDYMAQNPHLGRQDVMWQTPASSSGVNTPYESHPQNPGMSQIPNMPSSQGDSIRNNGMKHPFFNQPGMPGWGLPSPHGSDREAYF